MPNSTPSATLRLERDGEIAWIIADNPARMNALTALMWKTLPDLLADAERDDTIRVIVLRGAGERAFPPAPTSLSSKAHAPGRMRRSTTH